MALGDSYATSTELKARLDITVATYDTEITAALATASRDVDHWCRRQFNKTTTAAARVFHPQDGDLALVDDFHTTTDLAIATDDGDDGTYETSWTATDYQLEPLNGVVDGESGWPYWRIAALGNVFPVGTRRPSLEVTAQWGWTAVPASVKTATLILAAENFKLREAPYGVVGAGDFGVVRVQNNRKAAALLAPYRRNPVLVG